MGYVFSWLIFAERRCQCYAASWRISGISGNGGPIISWPFLWSRFDASRLSLPAPVKAGGVFLFIVDFSYRIFVNSYAFITWRRKISVVDYSLSLWYWLKLVKSESIPKSGLKSWSRSRLPESESESESPGNPSTPQPWFKLSEMDCFRFWFVA